MKKIIVVCLLLALFGCKTTPVLIEGPKATELSAEKDKQIAGLAAQVKAEQQARELEQALAAKASSNFVGVLKALEYMENSPAREAASEESKLGRERLGADDPVETVKALQRVIDIVTGQRDKALNDYALARNETAQERAKIAEKDEEIAKRDKELSDRQVALTKLSKEKDEEQAASIRAATQKDLDHKAEIKKLKEAYAAKERATWILWARIASLGLVVAGAVAIAVFKLAGAGGGLVGSGVLVGLISLGIEALTATWWFVYLCAGVFLIVVGLGIYGIYRLWIKHTLANKKTQAIQDMLDEATIRGDTKTIEELKAHLTYRLGNKTTFFGKEQAKEVVELGLVDPKGESAIKAASSSPTSG